MRLIVRIVLVFLGCLLLLSSGLLAYARREESQSSMWIYYASVKANGSTNLYRMLPNGSGRQLILEDTGFITRISFSPDGKSIVFDANYGETVSRVYRADFDGHNVTNISLGFDDAYAPSWSPDGEWIALMVYEADNTPQAVPPTTPYSPGYAVQSGQFYVYIMRPDGTERRRLAQTVPLGRPFWSPDSEWIAYVASGINDTDIARIRIDGSQQQRLTDVALSEGKPEQPTINPPGTPNQGIVVVPNQGVIIVPNQGANVAPMFPNGGRDLSPTWSPDGSQIAFLSSRIDESNSGYFLDVYVMNADGSNLQRLTSTQGNTGAPQWSPDGEWIAFVDDADDVYNIYRMRPDGSDMQKLTDNTFHPRANTNQRSYGLNDQANSWAPAWSPPVSVPWDNKWAFIGGGLLLMCSVATFKQF